MRRIAFETAVKKFNDTMYAVCLEHITIGTRHTEVTEYRNPNEFTVDDMIAEAKVWISEYGQFGCRDISECWDKDERADLRKEKKKLERFVAWATTNKDLIEPKQSK